MGIPVLTSLVAYGLLVFFLLSWLRPRPQSSPGPRLARLVTLAVTLVFLAAISLFASSTVSVSPTSANLAILAAFLLLPPLVVAGFLVYHAAQAVRFFPRFHAVTAAVSTLLALLLATLSLVAAILPWWPSSSVSFSGQPLPTTILSYGGPRLAYYGSLDAANDLPTLRAIIDASTDQGIRQVGGLPAPSHQCSPPYAFGSSPCWPDVVSSPGHAYVSLGFGSSWCTTASDPQIYRRGFHLDVTVAYHRIPNCRINGVVALPASGLLSFPTQGLPSGLYAIDYVTQSPGEDPYVSAQTYLSLPPPSPAFQDVLEPQAAIALTSTLSLSQDTIFSLARVDGSTLGSLCSYSTPGPVWLVVYAKSYGTSRSMQVALASPSPRLCSSTPI